MRPTRLILVLHYLCTWFFARTIFRWETLANKREHAENTNKSDECRNITVCLAFVEGNVNAANVSFLSFVLDDTRRVTCVATTTTRA
jgi:hypothetical protein